MHVLSVGELREGLSAVLDLVESGERVVVTRHGRPIASIGRWDCGAEEAGSSPGDEGGDAILVREDIAAYAPQTAGPVDIHLPAAAFVGGAGERLFSSRAMQRVLSVFVLHPHREFYQREVARTAGVSLRSAQLALERLVTLGFVDARRSGNRMHYMAIPSAAFDALRAWAIPEVSLVPVLREALAPLGDAIEMAFIYGSTASGADTATSDIDLMVVGDGDTYDVVVALDPVRARVGREINVTRYAPAEFHKKLAAGAHFVTEVMRGPILWVVGDEGSVHGS